MESYVVLVQAGSRGQKDTTAVCMDRNLHVLTAKVVLFVCPAEQGDFRLPKAEFVPNLDHTRTIPQQSFKLGPSSTDDCRRFG